jgi:hypothetical protein
MDKRKNGVSDIHCNLRELLRPIDMGLMGFEICEIYFHKYHRRYSDSTMTARLREMSDVVCDLSDYTYRLMEKNK